MLLLVSVTSANVHTFTIKKPSILETRTKRLAFRGTTYIEHHWHSTLLITLETAPSFARTIHEGGSLVFLYMPYSLWTLLSYQVVAKYWSSCVSILICLIKKFSFLVI